jgi:hypothetical protein
MCPASHCERLYHGTYECPPTGMYTCCQCVALPSFIVRCECTTLPGVRAAKRMPCSAVTRVAMKNSSYLAIASYRRMVPVALVPVPVLGSCPFGARPCFWFPSLIMVQMRVRISASAMLWISCAALEILWMDWCGGAVQQFRQATLWTSTDSSRGFATSRV